MMIGRRGKALRLAARRTRDHHRNFAIEFESLLHNAGLPAEEKPGIGGGCLVAEADLHLTAAVVSPVSAFDEAAAAER